MLGIIAFILAILNIAMVILVNKELDDYEKRMDKTFEELRQVLNELEKRRRA